MSKKEKSMDKVGTAAAFSLGLIAGYKGVSVMTHALYSTLVILTFIYSGGVVEWLLK